MRTFQPTQHRLNFLPREHDRQPLWGTSLLNVIEPRQLDAKHLSIQEQQRALCLILGRGCDATFHCEKGKSFLDMLRTQLIRMAPIKKDNEGRDPVHVNLFRANAVMLQADFPCHLIEQMLRLIQ